MTTRARKRNSPGYEGKACDAVVRCVEQRTGETRAAIRRPETSGIGPPVDFRLRLGAQEYAIEHTQIEAIPNLIGSDQRYMQLIKPVINEVSGTLPGPAVYALYFPIDTHLGVKPTDLVRIQRDFIAWIRAKAQRLYERTRDRLEREHKSLRYLDSIEAKPPGFPYPVCLWIGAAHSVSKRGVLRDARYAPDDEELETRRADRLREALRRKCPKLQRCKEDGARAVLVLESNDIALTNHVLVGECLAALLPERTDLPDEIYLVETEVNFWTVRCMKLDTECWPVEHLAELAMFHVDDLIDLHVASATGMGAPWRPYKRPIGVAEEEQHHDPTDLRLRYAHVDEFGSVRCT